MVCVSVYALDTGSTVSEEIDNFMEGFLGGQCSRHLSFDGAGGGGYACMRPIAETIKHSHVPTK